MTNTNGTNGTPSNGATNGASNGASNGGTNTNGGQSNTSNPEPPALDTELPITGLMRGESAYIHRVICHSNGTLERADKIIEEDPKDNMDRQSDTLTTGWGGNRNRVDILLCNGHRDFGEEATYGDSLRELERRLGDQERIAEVRRMRNDFDWDVGLVGRSN